MGSHELHNSFKIPLSRTNGMAKNSCISLKNPQCSIYFLGSLGLLGKLLLFLSPVGKKWLDQLNTSVNHHRSENQHQPIKSNKNIYEQYCSPWPFIIHKWFGVLTSSSSSYFEAKNSIRKTFIFAGISCPHLKRNDSRCWSSNLLATNHILGKSTKCSNTGAFLDLLDVRPELKQEIRFDLVFWNIKYF